MVLHETTVGSSASKLTGYRLHDQGVISSNSMDISFAATLRYSLVPIHPSIQFTLKAHLPSIMQLQLPSWLLTSVSNSGLVHLYMVNMWKKFTLEGPEREHRYSSTLFNLGSRLGWMVNAMPQLLYPQKETHYPLYRRLGWLQGQTERFQKILPPLEFDPRTIQPKVSQYTNYASVPWPVLLADPFCSWKIAT